jgi:hypothetical protein
MRSALLAVACLAVPALLPVSAIEPSAPSSAQVANPGPPQPGETAWLCRSKFFGVVYWGRLSHSSVAICPCGEMPAVPGEHGMVNNPRCTFYGTQIERPGFLLEHERLGVTYQPALLPVEEVKQRIRDEHRPWRLWRTCHVAAGQATGYAEPRRGLLRRCLDWWRALVNGPAVVPCAP